MTSIVTARAWTSVAAAAVLVWALGAAAVLGRIPPAALPLATALASIAAVALLSGSRLQARTKAALCAAAIALVVSTASGRSMTVPDSQPASEEPWTVLRHGTVLLDSAPVLRDVPDAHWIYRRPDGTRATWYPPGAPLLALPVYLPTVLTSAPTRELLSQFEKCAASLMSALTVLLLALALARAGSPPRFVFAGGLLYGLGTSALSTLSQALWHQTACALALALLLFAPIDPERRSSLVCAFLSGFIIFTTRPPDVLLLLPFLWAARSAPWPSSSRPPTSSGSIRTPPSAAWAPGSSPAIRSGIGFCLIDGGWLALPYGALCRAVISSTPLAAR